MFCKQCGKQVGEAQRFCSKCGAETMAVYLPADYTPPDDDQSRYAGLGYDRIGGFLLFVVAANIIRLFENVVSLFRNGMIDLVISMLGSIDLYEKAGKVSVILLAAGLLFSVVSILLLIIWLVQVFTRNLKFLFFYQIGVIVAFASNLLSVLSSASGFFASWSSEPAYVATLVGNVAGLFIFTYYFCKSVRVLTYMGSVDYKNYAIFYY